MSSYATRVREQLQSEQIKLQKTIEETSIKAERILNELERNE